MLFGDVLARLTLLNHIPGAPFPSGFRGFLAVVSLTVGFNTFGSGVECNSPTWGFQDSYGLQTGLLVVLALPVLAWDGLGVLVFRFRARGGGGEWISWKLLDVLLSFTAQASWEALAYYKLQGTPGNANITFPLLVVIAEFGWIMFWLGRQEWLLLALQELRALALRLARKQQSSQPAPKAADASEEAVSDASGPPAFETSAAAAAKEAVPTAPADFGSTATSPSDKQGEIALHPGPASSAAFYKLRAELAAFLLPWKPVEDARVLTAYITLVLFPPTPPASPEQVVGRGGTSPEVLTPVVAFQEQGAAPSNPSGDPSCREVQCDGEGAASTPPQIDAVTFGDCLNSFRRMLAFLRNWGIAFQVYSPTSSLGWLLFLSLLEVYLAACALRYLCRGHALPSAARELQRSPQGRATLLLFPTLFLHLFTYCVGLSANGYTFLGDRSTCTASVSLGVFLVLPFLLLLLILFLPFLLLLCQALPPLSVSTPPPKASAAEVTVVTVVEPPKGMVAGGGPDPQLPRGLSIASATLAASSSEEAAAPLEVAEAAPEPPSPHQSEEPAVAAKSSRFEKFKERQLAGNLPLPKGFRAAPVQEAAQLAELPPPPAPRLRPKKVAPKAPYVIKAESTGYGQGKYKVGHTKDGGIDASLHLAFPDGMPMKERAKLRKEALEKKKRQEKIEEIMRLPKHARAAALSALPDSRKWWSGVQVVSHIDTTKWMPLEKDRLEVLAAGGKWPPAAADIEALESGKAKIVNGMIVLQTVVEGDIEQAEANKALAAIVAQAKAERRRIAHATQRGREKAAHAIGGGGGGGAAALATSQRKTPPSRPAGGEKIIEERAEDSADEDEEYGGQESEEDSEESDWDSEEESSDEDSEYGDDEEEEGDGEEEEQGNGEEGDDVEEEEGEEEDESKGVERGEDGIRKARAEFYKHAEQLSSPAAPSALSASSTSDRDSFSPVAPLPSGEAAARFAAEASFRAEEEGAKTKAEREKLEAKAAALMVAREAAEKSARDAQDRLEAEASAKAEQERHEDEARARALQVRLEAEAIARQAAEAAKAAEATEAAEAVEGNKQPILDIDTLGLDDDEEVA